MSEKSTTRTDREMKKALAHPLRVKVLEKLQGRAASPAELSAELGESVATISYHAKTLVECGCLELVESRPRGGAIENFFTAKQPAPLAGKA